jgi:hypothetical protein
MITYGSNATAAVDSQCRNTADDNSILAAAWMLAYVSHIHDANDQDKRGLLAHDQSPANAAGLFTGSATAALNERIQTAGGMVGYLRRCEIAESSGSFRKPVDDHP